ncbi:Hypothetical protein Y17_2551 [Pectobacterium wasabiae CFBP 3304]|nr:Hypothetical protein Y17_2551 [Pectobacterium wasabiae CFBP 3304]
MLLTILVSMFFGNFFIEPTFRVIAELVRHAMHVKGFCVLFGNPYRSMKKIINEYLFSIRLNTVPHG